MWNEERVQELILFQQQHGHCDVPADDETYENLFAWIRELRSWYHAHWINDDCDNLKLSGEMEWVQDRIADLENLGLDLDLLGPIKRGKRRLKQLLEYKRLHGHHYRVGAPESADFAKLTEWLGNLRQANDLRSKEEEIPILMEVQLSQLEKVGYDINEFQPHQPTSREQSSDDRWNRRVDELKEFKRIHGHFQVPCSTEYKSLYNWKYIFESNYNRFLKGAKTERVAITDDRLKQLKAIGFDLTQLDDGPTARGTHADRWNRRVEELKEFKRIHGHFQVPRTGDYGSLYHWKNHFESDYKRFLKGEKTKYLSVTDDRVNQLKAIGFDLTQLDDGPTRSGETQVDRSNRRVEELKEFKRIHGHFQVPRKGGEELKDSTRILVIFQGLSGSETHVLTLNDLPKHSAKEQRNFKQLRVHFESPLGNESYVLMVDDLPTAARTNANVARNRQVEDFQGVERIHVRFQGPSANEKYVLTLDYQTKTAATNVNFEQADNDHTAKEGSSEAAWKRRVQELKDFKLIHGHFRIPSIPEYLSLKRWINRTRNECKKFLKGEKGSRITKDRLDQLKAIEFDLEDDSSGMQKPFYQQVEELKRFKETHGHFRVGKTGEHQSLGIWLDNVQAEFDKIRRGEKLKSPLTQERIRSLRAIGYKFTNSSSTNDASTEESSPPEELVNLVRTNVLEYHAGIESTKPSPAAPNLQPIAPLDDQVMDLQKFRDAHGHFLVSRFSGNYQSLGQWLYSCQLDYRRVQAGQNARRLTLDLVQQLEAIGFHLEWPFADDVIWNRGLKEMEDFIRQHGHHKVPANEPKHRSLRQWKQDTRREYNKYKNGINSRLTNDQVQQLLKLDKRSQQARAAGRHHQGSVATRLQREEDDNDDEIQVVQVRSPQGKVIKSSNSHTSSTQSQQQQQRAQTPSKADKRNCQPTPARLPLKKRHVASPLVRKLRETIDEEEIPPSIDGLEAAVESMTRELEKRTPEELACQGRPNQFWLKIGTRDGIDFFPKSKRRKTN